MNLEKMAEKLRSLLRFGPLSTRYKDIFDFCYLKDHVDMSRLADCIRAYIIDETSVEIILLGWRKRTEQVTEKLVSREHNSTCRN